MVNGLVPDFLQLPNRAYRRPRHELGVRPGQRFVQRGGEDDLGPVCQDIGARLAAVASSDMRQVVAPIRIVESSGCSPNQARYSGPSSPTSRASLRGAVSVEGGDEVDEQFWHGVPFQVSVTVLRSAVLPTVSTLRRGRQCFPLPKRAAARRTVAEHCQPRANESMRCHSRRIGPAKAGPAHLHAVDLHSEGFSSATNTTESSNQPVRRPSRVNGANLASSVLRTARSSSQGSLRGRGAVTAQSHHRREVPTRPEDNETVSVDLVGSPESRCWETVLRRDLGATAMREGEHGRHGRATRWVGRCPMALRASSPCRRSCHPRRPSGRLVNSWTAADPLPRTKSLRLAGKPGRPRSGTCGRASRRSVSRSPMRPAATRPGRSDSGPGGQEVGRICRDRTRHLWT